MSSNDEKLEMVGNLVDPLSTGKKLGLIVFAIGVLFTVFASGYWFGDRHGDSRVEAARLQAESAKVQIASANAKADAETAKYERKITELERKLISEKAKAGYRVDVAVVPPGHGEGLPDLESAPKDETSLAEFGMKLLFNGAWQKGKTSIQKENVYQEFVGRRFDWDGYVKDVWVAGKSNNIASSFGVEISSGKDGSGIGTATCYFHNRDEYRQMLESAKPGQKISVAGVLDGGGNLTKCKLLQLGGN